MSFRAEDSNWEAMAGHFLAVASLIIDIKERKERLSGKKLCSVSVASSVGVGVNPICLRDGADLQGGWVADSEVATNQRPWPTINRHSARKWRR